MLLCPYRAWQILVTQLFLGTGTLSRPILKYAYSLPENGLIISTLPAACHLFKNLGTGTSLSWVGWGPCRVSCPSLLIFRAVCGLSDWHATAASLCWGFSPSSSPVPICRVMSFVDLGERATHVLVQMRWQPSTVLGVLGERITALPEVQSWLFWGRGSQFSLS